MTTKETLTEVLHLTTGRRYWYNLSPVEAVRNAYLKYEVQNGNTWQYRCRKVPVQLGRWVVTCGDFTSLLHNPSQQRKYGTQGKYLAQDKCKQENKKEVGIDGR